MDYWQRMGYGLLLATHHCCRLQFVPVRITSRLRPLGPAGPFGASGPEGVDRAPRLGFSWGRSWAAAGRAQGGATPSSQFMGQTAARTTHRGRGFACCAAQLWPGRAPGWPGRVSAGFGFCATKPGIRLAANWLLRLPPHGGGPPQRRGKRWGRNG
jgi:hypothetical protein